MIGNVEAAKKGFISADTDGAEEEIREMTYDNAKADNGEDVPQIVVDRLRKIEILSVTALL